ncbi:hypothetical protein BDN71DRAFT_1436721 [Pleurotus eryngii]|uniref:Uncharacterized protein n=1 Tax=Pleurotus eryngii TaxID=5323 RepID=A0A9P5ZHL4_PLEER|nr:hypothetical protein BDN71DRAFT_1436721 [Pleurotus eryngii]
MLVGVVQGCCTALCTDLDSPVYAACWEQEYTNTLIATFDPGTLWDEFGVDHDIIPFTNDFPQADIHELLSPDLLHQIIKGTFKDHLVTWVGDYLEIEHSKTEAAQIMDDIDRREVFCELDHSLIHYIHLIQEFGAPNGLCSSITESRHITAVKKPWRRSNRWEALGQMLTTNQRFDKLAALQADYESRGMIPVSCNTTPKPKPHDPLDEDGCAPTNDLVQGNVSLARTRSMQKLFYFGAILE